MRVQALGGKSSQAAANNPYVIVGVFEGKCSHEQYPPIRSTPTTSPEARTEGAEEPADEETAEEESYVPATGQGCFSFEMSLLQRAAQTFAKRSVADHYLQVARWLQTGLATTISRQSWRLLSKRRTYTITPLALLRVHFKFGYLSTEQSDRKKPYAATDDRSQTVRDWEWHVNQVMPAGYLREPIVFAAREKLVLSLTSFG